MNPALQTRSAPEAVTADIPYTPDTGEKLINETFGPGNIRRRRAGPVDMRPMRINNGRLAAGEFSLERHGFRFVEHHTAVKDFFDKPRLETDYYREVEQLMTRCRTAARVSPRTLPSTIRTRRPMRRRARA